MVVNTCKVMQRLETGDSITCTVKAIDRAFGKIDEVKIKTDISHKFHKDTEEVLYYTVRKKLNGVKNNWKVKTLKDVMNILEEEL